MNKAYTLPILCTILLICMIYPVLGYDIQYTEDSRAYISAPAVIRSTGDYDDVLRTKTWSGDAIIAKLINNDDITITNPRYVTTSIDEIELSLTCDTTNSTPGFELNPKFAWCHRNTDGELLWNQSFKVADQQTNTIWWYVNQTVEHETPIGTDRFTKTSINVLGYNTMYYATGVHFNAGQTRIIRQHYDIPWGTEAKYDLVAYPQSYGTDVRQAYLDGNLYRLDPDINATFDYKNVTYAHYSWNASETTDDTGNGHTLGDAGPSLDSGNSKLGGSSTAYTPTDYYDAPWSTIGATKMSFSVWMDADASGDKLFGDHASSSEYSFYMYSASDVKMEFKHWTASTGKELVTYCNVSSIGNWVHLCGGYNGSHIFVMCNAQGLNITAQTGIMGNDAGGVNNWDIGQVPKGLPYDGNFDEFSMWINDSLTPTDCQHIYNNGSGRYYEEYSDGTGGGPPPDTIGPVITAVKNSSTNQSAEINWTTDENANASVNYTTGTGPFMHAGSSGPLQLNHNINLTGLSESTTYYYNVTSCDATGNCNTSGVYNFTTSDLTPPDITALSYSYDNETAEINWTTSENANASINYSAGTILWSGSSGPLQTSHNINLTGLSQLTTYYFNITSCDSSGNCQTNGTWNFTTTDLLPPGIINLTNDTITNETARISFNTTQLANASITWGYNTSPTTQGNYTVDNNLTKFNLTMYGLGNYRTIYYNITVCDNATPTNCYTAGPYNFTTLDLVAPIITITSPANGAADYDESVTFTYTPSDQQAMTCYLVYDATAKVYSTDTTITNGTSNSFLATGIRDMNPLYQENLNWSVACADASGNNATATPRTIHTKLAIPGGSGGAGGGTTNFPGACSLNITQPINSYTPFCTEGGSYEIPITVYNPTVAPIEYEVVIESLDCTVPLPKSVAGKTEETLLVTGCSCGNLKEDREGWLYVVELGGGSCTEDPILVYTRSYRDNPIIKFIKDWWKLILAGVLLFIIVLLIILYLTRKQ